jgi:hypothetical protein
VTVLKTWWMLTRLLLQGRGRYELLFSVFGLSAAAQDEYDRSHWVPTYTEWAGGKDRFVVLTIERDGEPLGEIDPSAPVIGCPTCRTIMRPSAVPGGCEDLWHAENQERIEGETG